MNAGALCIGGCGSPVTAQSRTGYCRPCSARMRARDPDKRAKCSAAMKARLADPCERWRHRMRLLAGLHRALTEDRAFRKSKRAQGRRLNRAAVEHFMGWCPLGYREEYRELRVRKRLTAAEARKAIEEQIRRELRGRASMAVNG